MIVNAIHLIFTVFQVMLLVRILSSWVPEIRDQKWLQFISFYTDPYLNIFRRVVPPIGVLDISPIIAFFALQLLESLMVFVTHQLIG